MHLVIINEEPGGITTREHRDIAYPKCAVADYAAHADCQLRPIQLHVDFSSWDLVNLYDASSLATATVEHVRLTPSEDGGFAAVNQVLVGRCARAAR